MGGQGGGDPKTLRGGGGVGQEGSEGHKEWGGMDLSTAWGDGEEWIPALGGDGDMEGGVGRNGSQHGGGWGYGGGRGEE